MVGLYKSLIGFAAFLIILMNCISVRVEMRVLDQFLLIKKQIFFFVVCFFGLTNEALVSSFNQQPT